MVILERLCGIGGPTERVVILVRPFQVQFPWLVKSTYIQKSCLCLFKLTIGQIDHSVEVKAVQSSLGLFCHQPEIRGGTESFLQTPGNLSSQVINRPPLRVKGFGDPSCIQTKG